MTWGRPRRWVSGTDEAGSRFAQIIRSVLDVVAGGGLRAGKLTWDDDAHVGFWLGVGTDGVARFSVGGPAFWLKWTGSELLVRGRFSTPGDPNELDLFVEGDAGAALHLRLKTECAAGAAGSRLEVSAGNRTVFTVDADGNVWAAGQMHAVGGVE